MEKRFVRLIVILIIIIFAIALFFGGKTIKEKRDQKKAALRVTIINKSTELLPPQSQDVYRKAIPEGSVLA